MKQIFLILMSFLLFSCSEPEQQTENSYKSKYDVVDRKRFEKLEDELKNFGLISFAYASVVSQQDICDIFEDTADQSDNEEYKKIMAGQLKECDFYRKLYEVVIPNFQNISFTNYNNYYYFEFKDEYSETNLTNQVGIFSNIENCNKFKDSFLEQELGFTSNCKKISKQIFDE